MGVKAEKLLVLVSFWVLFTRPVRFEVDVGKRCGKPLCIHQLVLKVSLRMIAFGGGFFL